MLLCGLWHGAAWTFVVWGAVHGLALTAHRMLLQFIPSEARPGVWWSAGGWLLTFSFVVVTWVFFRADNLHTAVSMLHSMVTPSSFETVVEVPNLGGEESLGPLFGWAAVLLAILWALVMPTTQELMRRVMRASMYRPYIDRVTTRLQPRWRPTTAWVVGSATIFAVAFLGLSRVSEFIYYNF